MKKRRAQIRETKNSNKNLLVAVLADSWTEELLGANTDTKTSEKQKSKTRSGMSMAKVLLQEL